MMASPDLLGSGAALASCFARDEQARVLPVDVRQVKSSDVTGSQTQTSQQEDDRAIPTTSRGRRITRGDDPLHVRGRQIARQRRETPRRDLRDRPLERRRASALRDEVSQERPQGRRDILELAVLVVEDEGSDPAGVHTTDVAIRHVQKLGDDAEVHLRGGFRQPAVLDHETTEGVEKRAFGRPPRVDLGRLDDPQRSQVRQKHPSPGHGPAALADLLPCQASTAHASVKGLMINQLLEESPCLQSGAQVVHNQVCGWSPA
jgi:hypothetical protein